MANTKTYKAKWSSDRAEAKFRAKEAVVWRRAKRQPEAIDVATRFGKTRAYRWAGTGTPVVFIHGMTDTSVRWIPYAEALEGHDIYALDIMGDVGRSTPDVGYTSADDYAVWLGDAIGALGITRPHIVGASLGGYIAFSYAMAPESVASVVGFEPVGIVDLRLAKLMGWSVRCAMAAFAPETIRRRLARRLRQPLLADKAAMELVLQAQRGHPIKLPPASVFTDEQLQSISAPVHVLAGAHSKAFDVHRLVDRINDVTQRGTARLLPNAGHAITEGHFDDCLAAIREAIALSADSGPGGQKCDLRRLPTTAVLGRVTPSWTAETVPTALRSAHHTAAWAELVVESGWVRFEETDTGFHTIVEPGQPLVIVPDRKHHVEPSSTATFHIRFFTLGDEPDSSA